MKGTNLICVHMCVHVLGWWRGGKGRGRIGRYSQRQRYVLTKPFRITWDSDLQEINITVMYVRVWKGMFVCVCVVDTLADAVQT